MSSRRGIVRLDGRRVGLLQETDEGSRFTYDVAWLANPDALPISLTLPLRAKPFESRGLLPFFENLLPEGWLLELSTAKLKLSKDDAFGLLLATCADCIGAVEVLPFPDGTAREVEGGEALSEVDGSGAAPARSHRDPVSGATP